MSVLQQANSQIESILTKLNINFKRSGKWLTASCSVHNGDNRGAFAFCTHTNKWVCFTQHCQQDCGNDILGLVRGVLSLNRAEAYNWLIENIDDVEYIPKEKEEEREDRIYPDYCVKKLFRTDFYLKRGFSQPTVEAFEHGIAQSKAMRNRVVFPIRDEKGLIRGFSGRWALKETQVERKGEMKTICVTDAGTEVPKWRHTSFKKTRYCYRLREAQEFCKDELIVVESIGNAMRFYDAGFKNCIACMGSFISLQQANLIMNNTKTAILAFDNDKAGKAAEESSRKLLEPFLNLKTIWTPEGEDWATLTNEQVLNIWNKTK